ncbi:MAG: hypothetical protein U0531_16825 [Dehalococcoidia bacterium]
MTALPLLPLLGAAAVLGAGVRFRVWAPDARRVELLLGAPPERWLLLELEAVAIML